MRPRWRGATSPARDRQLQSAGDWRQCEYARCRICMTTKLSQMGRGARSAGSRQTAHVPIDWRSSHDAALIHVEPALRHVARGRYETARSARSVGSSRRVGAQPLTTSDVAGRAWRPPAGPVVPDAVVAGRAAGVDELRPAPGAPARARRDLASSHETESSVVMAAGCRSGSGRSSLGSGADLVSGALSGTPGYRR